MEKTSCLAIILIIIVLGVWFVFVMPRISPKPIVVEEETPDTTLIEEEEPTIEEEKTLLTTAIFDTIETSLVSVVDDCILFV